MKTKSVQEGRQSLHNKQHSERGSGPNSPSSKCDDGTVGLEGTHEHTIPEHSGQLRVSERQSPKTQIRSCVRNGSENEFDGVDNLVDHNFGELKL